MNPDLMTLMQISSSNESFFSVENLVSLAISMFAAYLSWSCNKRVKTPIRVIYAATSFMFGTLYLTYYFLFRADVCNFGAKYYV